MDIGDSGAVVDIKGIGRPPYVAAGRDVDVEGECSSLISSNGGGGLMAREPEEVSKVMSLASDVEVSWLSGVSSKEVVELEVDVDVDNLGRSVWIGVDR